MKKVGILTWHYYPNFGSALQCWALQHTLESMRFKVEIINYRNPKYGKPDKWASLKYLIRCCIGDLHESFNGKFSYPFLYFQKKFLHETKVFTQAKDISKLAHRYQAIVYGSDQIWAPNVLNDIYLGQYVSLPLVKKISYAASLGLPSIPQALKNDYQSLLRHFNAVSVREKTGQEILKNECNIEASLVLDPTLLVSIDHYKKLERQVSSIEKPYIFCYFLNKEHSYRRKVSLYAQSKGLKLIGCSANKEDASWISLLEKIGPQEFLWLIANAETIITDSYHGSIFSLLYHKKYFCLERFQYNDPICQNSRIWQLNDYFNIEKCIIKHEENLRDYDYDYLAFEELLTSYRQSSIDFLTKSLK